MAQRHPAVLTDEGLLLPLRPPSRALVAVLGACAVAMVGVTVGLLFYAVQGSWRSLVGVLVSVPVALLFAAAARSMLREDRSGSTGLLLTPREVRLTDRVEAVAIPWEGVVRIEDTSPLADDADKRDAGWLAFVLPTAPEPGLEDPLRLLSGSSYPSINADDLVAGRDLVRAVCLYYLLHADERAQLTTPAALDRVADLA